MKKLTMFSNSKKLFSKIDLILAILGCLITPVLALLIYLVSKNILYLIPVFLSFFSCLIYLYIQRNISSLTLMVQLSSKNYKSLYFNVIFLLLFLCSILVFYLRPDIYTRPIEYFLLLAIISAFICLEILYVPYNKIYSPNILFKILLLSLSVSISELLIYPTIVGEDPFEHQQITTQLINSGYIPNNTSYSYLPIFHLVVGITSMIINFDYKSSVIFSISFMITVCTILFTFLLGTKLFNPKIGLLSVALLSISNRYIRMIYEATPNSLAGVYVLIIICLIFNIKYTIRSNKCIRESILLLVIMFVLVLTHSIASLWMCILLFFLFISPEIFKFIFDKNAFSNENSSIFATFLLFSCLMFFWWIYVSHHIEVFLNLLNEGFSTTKLLIDISTKVPFIEELVSTFPMFLFFSFSFIGCFYMLSQYLMDIYKFSLSICSLVTVAICFLGPVLKLFIIVGRWEYFSYLLLAIPFAVSIYLIVSTLKNNIYLPYLYFSFIAVISFLMIVSPISNTDNRELLPHSTARYGYMESEVQSIETFSEIWKGNVYVDGNYGVIASKYFTSVKSIDEMLYSTNFIQCKKSPIFIRKELIGKVIDMFRNSIILDYDPTQLLEKQKFSRIYDCGSVFVYSKY